MSDEPVVLIRAALEAFIECPGDWTLDQGVPALEALDRLNEAARFAYEFLGVLHDPARESSTPGETTCNVCRAADWLRAVLPEEMFHTSLPEPPVTLGGDGR